MRRIGKGLSGAFQGAAALAVLAAVLFPLTKLDSPWPETGRDYLKNHGPEETGAVNLVSSIYLGYRAFDTLGETIVLFLAVAGTVGLIQSARKEGEPRGGEPVTPGGEPVGRGKRRRRRRTVLMEVVSGKLGPVVLMFGLYVMLFGHASPGGGFQGGVVIASGLIFLLLGARDPSVSLLARREVLERLESAGFLLFMAAALAGTAAGAGFLANPIAGSPVPPEAFIILLNGIIGLKVGAGLASLGAVMLEETADD